MSQATTEVATSATKNRMRRDDLNSILSRGRRNGSGRRRCRGSQAASSRSGGDERRVYAIGRSRLIGFGSRDPTAAIPPAISGTTKIATAIAAHGTTIG
jgi:hypothetical protein